MSLRLRLRLQYACVRLRLAQAPTANVESCSSTPTCMMGGPQHPVLSAEQDCEVFDDQGLTSDAAWERIEAAFVGVYAMCVGNSGTVLVNGGKTRRQCDPSRLVGTWLRHSRKPPSPVGQHLIAHRCFARVCRLHDCALSACSPRRVIPGRDLASVYLSAKQADFVALSVEPPSVG